VQSALRLLVGSPGSFDASLHPENKLVVGLVSCLPALGYADHICRLPSGMQLQALR